MPSILSQAVAYTYATDRTEVLNRARVPAAVLQACSLARLLAQERWTLGIPNDATVNKEVYIDVKRDAIFYFGPPRYDGSR